MALSLPPPGDRDATEMAIAEQGEHARSLRRVLDEATATPIHISYRLGPEWFEGLLAALDELAEHLSRDPLAAMLLAEHALARLEEADLDDSDGWLTQALPRLEGIHAAACTQVAIDPRALASRLQSLAAASDLETFWNAPETHREALGERGLEALTRPPYRSS